MQRFFVRHGVFPSLPRVGLCRSFRFLAFSAFSFPAALRVNCKNRLLPSEAAQLSLFREKEKRGRSLRENKFACVPVFCRSKVEARGGRRESRFRPWAHSAGKVWKRTPLFRRHRLAFFFRVSPELKHGARFSLARVFTPKIAAGCFKVYPAKVFLLRFPLVPSREFSSCTHRTLDAFASACLPAFVSELRLRPSFIFPAAPPRRSKDCLFPSLVCRLLVSVAQGTFWWSPVSSCVCIVGYLVQPSCVVFILRSSFPASSSVFFSAVSCGFPRLRLVLSASFPEHLSTPSKRSLFETQAGTLFPHTPECTPFFSEVISLRPKTDLISRPKKAVHIHLDLHFHKRVDVFN